METAAQQTSARPLIASPGFVGWLAKVDASVAFTTYQAGRLFMLGRRPDGGLRGHQRQIENCQGLWTDGDTMWLSSKTMLWRFENELPVGETTPEGAARRFCPREARVTGEIDIHDIGMADFDGVRGPLFVATAYNCLGSISDRHSFRAVWRPPFISRLTAEDRCHLNGLAMDGGRPRYLTAVSRSDVADGWRDRRGDGGIVIDVASGEIVATGLSMPHSPRIYRDRLWILNSGTGDFGHVDPATGAFEPIAFCPGFARGLAFVDRYAVIGLSRPRNNLTFEGLPLQGLLESKDTPARCGLIVVDLESGRIVEWVRFEAGVSELYDVAVLHGVPQAEVVGLIGDAVGKSVTVE